MYKIYIERTWFELYVCVTDKEENNKYNDNDNNNKCSING